MAKSSRSTMICQRRNKKSSTESLNSLSSTKELRMITKDAVAFTKCTGDRLATITGRKMCGEMRMPFAAEVATAPYFPLTGPVNMRLAIEKVDTKLTGYTFEASRTDDEGVAALKVIFDTPGSEINRELSMIFSVDKINKAIDFNLRSPWKKVSATANLINAPELKKINAKVVVDETREYSAAAVFAMQTAAGTTKIIPELTINWNGATPIIAGGSIILEQ